MKIFLFFVIYQQNYIKETILLFLKKERKKNLDRKFPCLIIKIYGAVRVQGSGIRQKLRKNAFGICLTYT